MIRTPWTRLWPRTWEAMRRPRMRVRPPQNTTAAGPLAGNDAHAGAHTPARRRLGPLASLQAAGDAPAEASLECAGRPRSLRFFFFPRPSVAEKDDRRRRRATATVLARPLCARRALQSAPLGVPAPRALERPGQLTSRLVPIASRPQKPLLTLRRTAPRPTMMAATPSARPASSCTTTPRRSTPSSTRRPSTPRSCTRSRSSRTRT